jgi:DNA-directed RNA polymerase specialized sigma24 family protein
MLEAAELFELIGRAFPNEAHRAAFDEIVIDERPYSEVADRFNISPDTLRQWICRDKKRIRKVILTCMQ